MQWLPPRCSSSLHNIRKADADQDFSPALAHSLTTLQGVGGRTLRRCNILRSGVPGTLSNFPINPLYHSKLNLAFDRVLLELDNLSSLELLLNDGLTWSCNLMALNPKTLNH